MSELNHEVTKIDEILKQLGLFGRYQKKRWILCVITVWAFLVMELTYVYVTIIPNYRCFVPPCETADHTEFQPIWLNNAVPFKDNQPLKCERFEILNGTNQNSAKECDSELFNINVIEKCNEFVLDTQHSSIIQEFKLLCDKTWMDGIPGSVHSFALFFSLPISGYIADRIGRKKVITFGLIFAAIFCFIKSFSTSFWMYVVLEFLQAGTGSGTFPSIYTLIAELSPAENRIFGCVITFGCSAIAQMSVACIAWQINSWCLFIRLAIIPSALIVFFIPSFMPESIRWLICQNKFEEAKTILENIAAENGTELSDNHKLQLIAMRNNLKDTQKISNESLKDLFKHIPMIIRLVTCSLCWITCTFVYHGLFLMTGVISGNPYLNFILVGLVEIPGTCISFISCRRYGRKFTISTGLTTAGICCGCYIFIPDRHWLRLIMFLLGKCSITTAFGSLYIITTEIYPTPFRQTLLGICSMAGRIGQISAPQMPVLATIWSTLPILIFSLMSIAAGILSLVLPETLNTSLPDTIEEAMDINKKTVENTHL